MKSINLIVAALLTFILLGALTLIPIFFSRNEPSYKVQMMLDDIESSYSEILDQLPAAGSEKSFYDEASMHNLGEVHIEGKYSISDNIIPFCEEYVFKEIAKGEHKVDLQEYENNLIHGEFGYVDVEHCMFEENLQDFEYERDLSVLHGVKNIVIFRSIDRYNGSWEGEVIYEISWYEGWFFLIDVPSRKVIGAEKISVKGGEEAWEYENDGIDPLIEDLNRRILLQTSSVINKWCKTEGIYYLDYFN